jgi:hypothetical protein
MTELTDEQAKARIAAMTMPERLALVIRCEEAWHGTPWQPKAELLRAQYEQLRKTIN